jgi:hypothetical protein
MSCFIKDCFLKLLITAKEHYFALKVGITTKKESHREVQDDIRPGGYKKKQEWRIRKGKALCRQPL